MQSSLKVGENEKKAAIVYWQLSFILFRNVRLTASSRKKREKKKKKKKKERKGKESLFLTELHSLLEERRNLFRERKKSESILKKT